MYRLLIALALSLSFASCAQVPIASRPIVRVAQSTWSIRTPFGMGTGSVVGCEWDGERYAITVLTAKHVLVYHDKMQGMPLLLRRGPKSLGKGVVISVHKSLDVALVRFYSPDPIPVIRICEHPVLLGDELIVAGFSGGRGHLWVSRGVACGPERATCPVAPGDSGGPVFGPDGDLVGVIAGVDQLRNGGHVYHHLHYVAVTRFISWLEANI
jgi:S1-C subfamily serine protease